MKNKEKNSKLADFLLGFFSGFIEKLSWNVVFNAKKQVDEIVFKIKSGFLVLVFMVLGLIFVVVGLTVFLNEALNLFPGDGYFLIGLASIIMGMLVALFSKGMSSRF
ncbi:MAG: hypothetical protein R6V40_02965 [Candidatus Moraniibacteriota bacterium]